MLKLYKNKFQTFECAVEIEGADISEAKSRIILYPNNDTRNILYSGIVKNHRCIVNINSNVNVGKEGTVVLEVLVDDSLIFTPWEDTYVIVDKVKVLEANLYEQESTRPRVIVKDVKTDPEIRLLNDTIVKIAEKKGKTVKKAIKKDVKVTVPLEKKAEKIEKASPVEIIDPPVGKVKNAIKEKPKEVKVAKVVSKKEVPKEKTELEELIEKHGSIQNINIFELVK